MDLEVWISKYGFRFDKFLACNENLVIRGLFHPPPDPTSSVEGQA